MSDSGPLTLAAALGTHRILLTVPGVQPGSSFTEVGGDLQLAADAMPSADVYGSVPIRGTSAGRAMSYALPQEYPFPVLHGQLQRGNRLALLGATVTTSGQHQARVHAAAAVVGRGQSLLPEDLAFPRVEIQVGGLDRVAGFGPLATFKGPPFDQSPGPRNWAISESKDLCRRWSDDTTAVQLGYALSISAPSAFAFRFRSSPHVIVEVDRPIAVSDWVSQWVEPLRSICTALMGVRQEITYLQVAIPNVMGSRPDLQPPLSATVYGTGLTQAPYLATDQRGHEPRPVLTLDGDGLSLLDLIRSWQRLDNERHPLLQTYGAFLTVPPQHPRARYLLLVQALEGHYGHASKDAAQAVKDRYRERYDDVIEHLSRDADVDVYKFVRRNLNKWPRTSLDDAFRWSLAELPENLTGTLAATGLVQRTWAEVPKSKGSVAAALRWCRNALAHGSESYEIEELHDAAEILERVTRAHMLRLLGCDDSILRRALVPDR